MPRIVLQLLLGGLTQYRAMMQRRLVREGLWLKIALARLLKIIEISTTRLFFAKRAKRHAVSLWHFRIEKRARPKDAHRLDRRRAFEKEVVHVRDTMPQLRARYRSRTIRPEKNDTNDLLHSIALDRDYIRRFRRVLFVVAHEKASGVLPLTSAFRASRAKNFFFFVFFTIAFVRTPRSFVFFVAPDHRDRPMLSAERTRLRLYRSGRFPNALDGRRRRLTGK